MDHHLFQIRLQMGALTIWELGDLLGIHPHLLHTMQLEYLDRLPIKVIIELAHRLDMHPADIVADLDSILDNPCNLEPHMPRQQTGELADDAHALLAALAHAAVPLLIDDIATALQWSLERTYAALDHARAHPELAGPHTIERISPETYVRARACTCSTAPSSRPSTAPPTTTSRSPKTKPLRCYRSSGAAAPRSAPPSASNTSSLNASCGCADSSETKAHPATPRHPPTFSTACASPAATTSTTPRAPSPNVPGGASHTLMSSTSRSCCTAATPTTTRGNRHRQTSRGSTNSSLPRGITAWTTTALQSLTFSPRELLTFCPRLTDIFAALNNWLAGMRRLSAGTAVRC